MKGREYSEFYKIFAEGDWVLSRVFIEANKIRFYDILKRLASLISTGGRVFPTNSRDKLMSQVKEIYLDIMDTYRLLSTFTPHSEKEKQECLRLSDALSEYLLDLRNLELSFRKLNNYMIYSRYNRVMKQVGRCESVAPRIIDAFRTTQVKQKFEKEFGELFSRIDDLLSPVSEKNLIDYEDKIIKLFSEGKTLEEVAKAINVNVKDLSDYINQYMSLDDISELKEDEE